MAAKDIGVKKYVVRLSEAERDHLQALINKGKSPAKRLLKARILLKADVGAQGEGWSDGQIIEALDTNKSMVTRVRQQLVEEGLEAVLSRKERAAPAITPIFDGEKEARLVALACSTPPEGRARWTLRLLEDKVPRTPRKSLWCRTISTRTSKPPFTKPFRPPRPSGSLSASNGITRQSMAVGSVRVGRSFLAMPRSPHPGQRNAEPGSRRMASRSQQTSDQGQLALHNRRRPHQAQAPLSSV